MPFRDTRIDRPDRPGRVRRTLAPGRRPNRVLLFTAIGGVVGLLAGVAVGVLLVRMSSTPPDGGMEAAGLNPADELPVGPPVELVEPVVALPLEGDERPMVFGWKGQVGVVELFASRAAMEEYHAFLKHGLPKEVERMERDGTLMLVAAGTPGAIRDERETEATVRVLSGPHAGQKGVIPTAWYHVPKN